MTKKTILIATAFVLCQLAFIAPFVPLGAVLPTGFGMLSLMSMAITLILAARWRVVDRVMGGPDKSYAAHRWLGFFAVGGALGHWVIADSVGAGMFPALADGAEDLGSLAAMGLLIMSAAAMVRAIPYRVWKVSHMLMGPVFVLAAVHSFFVASPVAFGTPPWTVMAGVSALGLVAWVQTLVRKVAPTRLVTVERVTTFEGGVDVTLRASKALRGFRAGQFATLADNRARAEAHPFTIAGGDATSRRFVIRAAGDWTDDFIGSVQVGDEYRLGRGVGRFLPQTHSDRTAQLWVAGGVGITPFLAALEQMKPDANGKVVLIYCIRSRTSAGGLTDVERHAARLPQLKLIVLSNDQNNALTPACLDDVMCNLPLNAQVYLCGPDGLKDLVSQTWHGAGRTARIHSERFDFRGALGLTDLLYLGKPVVDAARRWSTVMKEKTHAPFGS